MCHQELHGVLWLRRYGPSLRMIGVGHMIIIRNSIFPAFPPPKFSPGFLLFVRCEFRECLAARRFSPHGNQFADSFEMASQTPIQSATRARVKRVRPAIVIECGMIDSANSASLLGQIGGWSIPAQGFKPSAAEHSYCTSCARNRGFAHYGLQDAF
jgi:hypothetical protein